MATNDILGCVCVLGILTFIFYPLSVSLPGCVCFQPCQSRICGTFGSTIIFQIILSVFLLVQFMSTLLISNNLMRDASHKLATRVYSKHKQSDEASKTAMPVCNGKSVVCPLLPEIMLDTWGSSSTTEKSFRIKQR